ncbi:MAG TPA: hypothetical protein DEE98_05520 [Elusimicrobia bacterium]|nr:MAG: hypothetical protein A2278_01615 [Elusimicrobia bacterium RIFOXYA12_FULL_49_49]OGS11746.1 MAG: hypothetical protein A2386_01650 [Elusimicrobia bacterium RIFOXYB1_FULL_48_9]OGS16746.1 MAG: hypothetical protein A2251_05065 [Elusimicrobia bacterium RIFOXYA2_FULL_47_53]OGS27027.1 MAG: hypothetical protein A2339_04920 [Elusimicrobia bacterium RIFOXYB12_FULL_50_12]OGS31974.1 MAG: hypothetical protein A2323_07840 [Elusimicrobia bacterium RIFOXYB2_FULL_46_23]HBU69826.1 hypothetical protein [El
MKILHRYIIREFLESFFFGLAVFSFILLLDQIFQLVNLFLSKGISLFLVAKLFVLILPNIFSLTIPMSVLLGILLAYGRFSEDNEITSMRSAGMGYFSFTSPVLAGVLCLSLFLVFFNQTLSPVTHRQFRQIYKEVLSQHPLVKFEEKTITRVGDYRMYVDTVAQDGLKGVNIYKFSPSEAGVPWRISAASATVSVGQDAVLFLLYNGYWQKANPAHPENLIHLKFSSYQFTIPLGGEVIPVSQSLREMSGRQLRVEMKAYRDKKMPTNFIETEYWLRWTLAFAPFVFAVVGIPLGIVLERGGRSIGFGISLLVLFAYYLLLVTGLNMGEKGYAAPKYVLMLPNAAAFLAGLWLWRKMLKK